MIRGANAALAACLVDEWARLGLRHACVSPGSRSGPLALALGDHPDVRLHVLVDERSAAFFALGLARETRAPVPVVCTSGTAAANLHPALLEARHGGVPLIALTADRPPELRGTGANQTVDQVKLFGDTVAWFGDAGVPEVAPHSVRYWRSLACRAWAEALAPPCAPVHLNVPLREPLVPSPDEAPFPHALDGRDGGEPWTRAELGAPRASDETVAALARELRTAERGVIVAGATDLDVSPLLELGERLGWPVLAEPASSLRVPGTVAAYDALLRVPAFADAHRPDLVLRVGRLGLGRPLSRHLDGVRQIALGGSAPVWHDEQRCVARLVVGDVGDLCRRLGGELPPRRSVAWSERWARADAAAREAIASVLDAEEAPGEPRTARDLARLLPAGARLVVGSSMPVRDLDSFMEPRTGITVHANRGVNGIDGFVSTTLGIAAAADGPTFALAGDLSLLHDQNGLLYPGRGDLDVTFVVLMNDGGGIFSFLEQAGVAGFEEVFGTPHGLDLSRLAALYGLAHRRLERASELEHAVAPARGPRIVEVRTDRRENVAAHRRIWDAVARSVSVSRERRAPPASRGA